MKRVGESEKWVTRPRGGRSKKTLVKKLLIGATVECNQRKDLITYVDKPTTVQQGGVGLGYVRVICRPRASKTDEE